MAAKTKIPRDYRAEYQRRKALGKAQGKSTSQARGHARAGERPGVGPVPYKRSEALEQALRLMKHGVLQRQAAKQVGVPVERLRRFLKENTTAHREGRRWVILDKRPVSLLMATRGKQQAVNVPADAGSDIGRHWSDINRFLATNNVFFLKPYEGMGVSDVDGKFHPYETRPNVLRKLDSVGELSFIDIYADVAK